MEVHQARAFLAVAQELHFGRAADRLQMAQPPLSRHIKRLERELGATLFDRSTRHVALTSAGQALLQPARALVDASATAHHVVADAAAGHTGTVRFGFAGASVHDLVGRLARRVRTEQPGLVLEVHSSQFSHVAFERVRDESLDLAIGRWDFIPDELDSLLVAEEEVLLAVPADHPLAADPGPVDLADLRDEEWLSLPGGFVSALANRLPALGMRAGFAPRVVQTAPDSWTLLVLVAAGLGCALTLDSVRDNTVASGVVFRPIAGWNPPLQVRLLWRRRDASPALHAVLELARGVPDAGTDDPTPPLTVDPRHTRPEY